MNFSRYSALSADQLIKDFNINPDFGLSPKDVEISRAEHGINKLKEKTNTWWPVFIKQFKSSFIYLLVFASFISFFLGEPLDAFFILLFIFINVSLGFYYEYKSEKTVRLLKNLVVKTAHVKRGGKIIEVSSDELVVGDFVMFEAGDVICADVRFLRVHDLMVDESMLSGESIAVRKSANALKKQSKHVFTAQNIGFSGTNVVSGDGEGIVISVGEATQVGNIFKLSQITVHEGIFEKDLSKISTFIFRLVFGTLVLVFLSHILIKGTGSNIVSLLIFSIALAVSVIPEALPVVATFALSRGALNLAKHQVVVKRLASIQDLGSIDLLCTDKTGTLTENNLKVSEVYSEDIGRTLFYGFVASSVFTEKRNTNNSFDVALAGAVTQEDKLIAKSVERLNELSFDPVRKRNSVMIDAGGACELVVRGAPENLIDLSISDGAEKEKALDWLTNRSLEGKRVICVCKKGVQKAKCDINYGVSFEESDLKFVGLISFEDPIKDSAVDAIKRASELGIGIKILTGDNREVSGAVAYKTGLVSTPLDVISGTELEKMDTTEFADACLKYAVFARLSPEQKLKVIKVLKNFHQVGYLGDGINDALALKAANVSMVVNDALDIARESADIILLQKGLGVIIDGVNEGRQIYANITKYIRATLSSNFGNFYAVALSSFFIPYLPLLPTQILLLNLLSDFPMIAISGDTVDASEVKNPSKLDIKQFGILSSILGVVSTIFDLTLFSIFLKLGENSLQTYWFMGSVLTELVFIFSIRTKGWFFKAKLPSLSLTLISVVAALAAILVPFTSFGSDLMRFVSPTLPNLYTVGVIVVSYFVVSEIVKKVFFSINSKRFN